jgi:pimeloyl-ACP methyl ester carboxylesterase
VTDLAIRLPVDPPGPHSPEAIIVHGVMDRGATFEPTRRRMPDVAVTLYDRRGYGDSPHGLAQPDLSAHVADLIEIIDGRRTILIGHSFGGLVAIGAAVELPQLVLAVGLYEPPMPWLDEWPSPPAFGSPADAAEIFFRTIVGKGAWEALPEGFREDRCGEGPALLGDFASAQNMSVSFADVMCPVAVAHGSKSAPHYVEAARTLADGFDHAPLTVIDGAAHGVHLSHPDGFAAWIVSVVELASAR